MNEDEFLDEIERWLGRKLDNDEWEQARKEFALLTKKDSKDETLMETAELFADALDGWKIP